MARKSISKRKRYTSQNLGFKFSQSISFQLVAGTTQFLSKKTGERLIVISVSRVLKFLLELVHTLQLRFDPFMLCSGRSKTGTFERTRNVHTSHFTILGKIEESIKFFITKVEEREPTVHKNHPGHGN